jgi:cytochrome c-type biogenesis protein CcmF
MTDFQGIEYVGEMALPGRIGHVMVLISVFTALFAAFYYWLSERKDGIEKQRLAKAANWIYGVHTIAIITIGVILYYLILSHRFEYNYVWRYSSMSLPVRYIIASMWAGQEGSFWVWALLQGLTGLYIVLWVKNRKAPVMAVVAFSQFFLTSMMLGIHVLGFKIGSSPFALMRELPEYIGESFFMNPNYVEQIADGLGLNPLLENPWMVSHPPVLFLGYAFFVAPYAYALAGLWKNDFTGWIKPAMPWVIVSLIALGAGILLGGRWAYESLTFGGFWAWDPVENASLVPWLVLIGALHFMLLNLKRKQNYRATFIFTFLGFLFILYATFLTRSGILAETSVHSFSADKKYQQLVLYMAAFSLIPLILLIRRWKKIPHQETDNLLSRDFLLFAGSIVLLLSSFQIIFATSIPVINAVLGTNMAPPSDPVEYYNSWQLPFAVMIVGLIALSQFLNYGKNDSGRFFRNLLFSALVSVALTLAYSVFFPARFMNLLLLGFSIFAVMASLDYMLRFVRRPQNIAASIAHIGFGIFLAAVVLTFTNEKTISRDPVTHADNVKLVKGQVTRLADYHVVYSDRYTEVNETFYTLDFLRLLPDSTYAHEFTLVPSINRHPQMGQVSNPATRHKMMKDIYTYVSHAHEVDFADADGYSMLLHEHMTLGDTLVAMRSFIIFDSLRVEMPGEDFEKINLHARFQVKSMMFPPREVWVSYHIDENFEHFGDVYLEELEIKLRFEHVTDQAKTIVLGIYAQVDDHIVVRAIIFPYIRLLWIGTFIMLAGFIWSLVKRIKRAREQKQEE